LHPRSVRHRRHQLKRFGIYLIGGAGSNITYLRPGWRVPRGQRVAAERRPSARGVKALQERSWPAGRALRRRTATAATSAFYHTGRSRR
jgi:hypothetical protein